MISSDHHGDVWILRLSRPERRNALTPEMLVELDRWLQDPEAEGRSLVLAGDGPVFCGGFDLRMCLDKPETLRELLIMLSDTIRRLRRISMPVVIAAHGAAIAGGCALLGGADYVVTDRAAKLGYPVVPLGISPAVSAPFLRMAIGDGLCRERLLDPALISGEEAVRIGLAHECVGSPGEVIARAVEVAATLSAKPQGAWQRTKQWLDEIAASDERDAGWYHRTAADQALSVSLSLVGRPEERDRLAAMFAKK